MGQKIHPRGLRLGISQNHRAKWCTTPKNYAYFILEDRQLRQAVWDEANARQLQPAPTSGRRKSPRRQPSSGPRVRKSVTPDVRKRKPVPSPRRSASVGSDVAKADAGVRVTKTPSALELYRRRREKLLKPKANVHTMFHTSMFERFRRDKKAVLEISDIFIHRRRLHHNTDLRQGYLDVIEVYVHTTRPVQLIHGTDNASLTKSVIRYQKALERAARALRPPGAPRVRVLLNVFQVTQPKHAAAVLAARLIRRLENRESFRGALKQVSGEARKALVDGVKIQISGRLNGAEIARTEWVRHGRVPAQTLRANLDYSYQTAKTTYGILGIKVWTYQNG